MNLKRDITHTIYGTCISEFNYCFYNQSQLWRHVNQIELNLYFPDQPVITFTDNLLREPQAPEHIAVNESWDKMDSQAIRLAEVALMLMMTICSQNHIPTFIVLCHRLGNQTKFCVFYTKTFIMTCLFYPNLLHTCNVLAMYSIHTWTGPHQSTCTLY